MAVSVLPLSTTYAICESFGFERGLDHQIKDAPVFYGIFAFIVAVAVAVVLIPGIPLFQIMVLSQSMNAILLPVLLVLVLKLANDPLVMGEWRNKRFGNGMAISLTVLISLVTLVLLVSPFIA
mgnify:FL=1